VFAALIKLWKDSEFDDYFAVFLPTRLPHALEEESNRLV